MIFFHLIEGIVQSKHLATVFPLSLLSEWYLQNKISAEIIYELLILWSFVHEFYLTVDLQSDNVAVTDFYFYYLTIQYCVSL